MIDELKRKQDSFSARLLEETCPYWENYLRHPFILALANGSLDPGKYRYYMMQDYLYLKEYGKCFEAGMEKGEDAGFRRICQHYLERISNFELEVHRGAFEALGITQEQLESAMPSIENLGYTSYMLKECYEGGQEEILCAVLACALSYEFIAHETIRRNPGALENPLYGDWFAQYDSESYALENVVLCSLMDALVENLDEKRKEHLEEIFMNCSRFELGFWNRAWLGEKETL